MTKRDAHILPVCLGDIPVVLALLGTLLFASSARAQISDEEMEALVALYTTTGGDTWTHSENWLTDADVDTWYGIRLSGSSTERVAGINLSGNNLRGPLPIKLLDLRNLVDLDLSNNELTGNLSAGFSSLTRLNVILLNNNPALKGTLSEDLADRVSPSTLRYDGTQICAPGDVRFRVWLSSISNLATTGCFLDAPDEQPGFCAPSEGEAYLDANNVRARIPNNGELFYRGEPHVYNAPRFSNANAIFASSIWIGGVIDGETRVAATRYGPYEFWAGPLDDDGMPPADCRVFDRVYKVSRQDIESYDQDGGTPRDLSDWPTGLGAPTIDAGGNILDLSHLPFSERLTRTIDLPAGERPHIVGDVGLWWISNDRGNVHEATDSEPLGVELHGFAYALTSSEDALNNATFYRYTIINRGTDPVRKTYIGIFSDPDLGDAGDDYVGSDTLRNMGYVYNADDDDTGGEGYGRAPPAVGYRILRGPLADDDGIDNNRNSLIDEPDERPGMSHFVVYNSGGGPNGDPATRHDYYNFMRGLWKNGNPMLFGGDAFETGVTSRRTNYMYPGDPVTGSYWSEVNTDGQETFNEPADRRFVLSSGPFDLLPGQAKEIDFAIVYGRGADHLDSIEAMRRASDVVQTAFEAGFAGYPPGRPVRATTRPLLPLDGSLVSSTSVELTWSSTPGSSGYTVSLVDRDGERSLDGSSTRILLEYLDPNTLYFWRVRPADAYGSGPWSEWQYFVTAPSASFGLVAIAPEDGTVVTPGPTDFVWSSDAEAQRIEISTGADLALPVASLTDVAPGFSFVTEPYQQYTWRVWNRQDGWSRTWTFTTIGDRGVPNQDLAVLDLHHYPNPLSGGATIRYYLRKGAHVRLEIRDLLGRLVAVPLDRYQYPGLRTLPIDASRMSGGTYFYRLTAGRFSMTRAMVVAH